MLSDNIALTDGAWVHRRGILVWQHQEWEPPGPAEFMDELIACPTCRARLTQHCRTFSGRHRKPHGTRLVSRRCGCGEVLRYGRQRCDECRDDARRANARVSMRNTRARRRANDQEEAA